MGEQGRTVLFAGGAAEMSPLNENMCPSASNQCVQRNSRLPSAQHWAFVLPNELRQEMAAPSPSRCCFRQIKRLKIQLIAASVYSSSTSAVINSSDLR